MCNKLGTPCLFQKQKQEHSPLKGTLITQAVSLEIMSWMHLLSFPAGSVVKNLPGQCRRHRLDPWIWKTPCRRKWQPALGFLPGKCHGQRSLAGYGPWGCKESDMTKRLNWTELSSIFRMNGQWGPTLQRRKQYSIPWDKPVWKRIWKRLYVYV